jgi:hypothetical protein
MFVFVCSKRTIPESPRWLLSKGKLKDLIKVLKRIAKSNNKELPERYKNLRLTKDTTKAINDEKAEEKEVNCILDGSCTLF